MEKFEKTQQEEVMEQEPQNERGLNVFIRLKFIRHGEKTKVGELTNYGRKITRENADKSNIKSEDFDAFKAYGSPAGPKGETGMQRSLETAHIFAEEVGGEKQFKTRKKEILNYETLKLPVPYNHTEIYNANLPENFDALSDEEKAKAARKAQTIAVRHFLSLDTPEAIASRKEVTGSFAKFIGTYQKMAGRLKSDSRVLAPVGTHGGLMEPFLQEALIRVMPDGTKIHGFKDLDEIGGAFDPSESFDVDIATDENGEPKRINIKFDNPERPSAPEMYLDPQKLEELKEFYEKIHERKE